ncbi:MAG: DinB family protein [Pirellulaceae bacterium]|nr:DinB family protein [Pirellulaceae bacterium]
MQSLYTLDPHSLTDPEILCIRDQAIAQLRWARDYTMELVSRLPHESWYVIPSGLSTHMAWQVGHLAVAEYGLMLFRQRGRAEGDVQLMPGWLRKQFGRGSQPAVSSADMPTPEQLLEHLGAIHRQAILEASQLTVTTLRQPCDIPYCVYPTKLGALMMAPIHEGIHAGQIGLVRRGHGLESLR